MVRDERIQPGSAWPISFPPVADLQATIGELWEGAGRLAPGDPAALAPVREAIDLLDRGEARVAEVGSDGAVVVHEWLKQAILLYFKLSSMQTTTSPVASASAAFSNRLKPRRSSSATSA